MQIDDKDVLFDNLISANCEYANNLVITSLIEQEILNLKKIQNLIQKQQLALKRFNKDED